VNCNGIETDNGPVKHIKNVWDGRKSVRKIKIFCLI